MPVPTVKFFESPLLFSNVVFDRAVVNEGKGTKEVLKRVLIACNEEISAGGLELIRTIPILTADNLTSVKSGTIVRYRCMITDMRGPEYYVSLYSTSNTFKPHETRLHCNLWRETVKIAESQKFCEDGGRQEISERQIFVGGSNPAEAPWIRQFVANDNSVGTSPPPASSVAAQMEADPNTRGKCLIKVYQEADRIKLNDVVEVIGLYYNNNCDESSSEQSDDSDGGGLVAAAAAASSNNTSRATRSKSPAWPTVHVFTLKKLRHQHPDPAISTSLLPCHQVDPIRAYLLSSLNEDVTGFRDLIINGFKENLLNGDELASEYLLCNMLSHVYRRYNGVPVGQMTLNLFNVPKLADGLNWAASVLFPALGRIVTQVSYLPLSLPILNDKSLVPRKCNESGRLMGGRLQLPHGTELVIDETRLQPGPLNTNGVKNVTALRTMIKWQKLDYDFIYSTGEFHTDMRTLVISDGPSILPNDFSVLLQAPNGDTATAVNASTSVNHVLDQGLFTDKAFLEKAQIYFALMPLLHVKIDQDMQRRIEADFVFMRRSSASGSVNESYLHRLLTLAKTLGLTYGDSNLRVEIWEKAKRMEAERLTRMEQRQ